MQFGCKYVCSYLDIPKSQAAPLFIFSFICLSTVGAIINNYFFNTAKPDYYAIVLLKMDGKKYVLSRYMFSLGISFITHLIFLLLIGNIVLDIDLHILLLMAVFFVACKITFSVITLYKAITDNNLFIILQTVIIIATLTILIALPINKIFIPINIMIIVMTIFSVTGILSAIRLFTYSNYTIIYRKIIIAAYNDRIIAQNSGDTQSLAQRELMSSNTDIVSTKTGYSYIHELFIKRHKRTLWKPSLILSSLLVAFFAIIVILILIYSKTEGIEVDIINLLPASLFIMYFLNRGLAYTQALYVNCDHSMLTFSFYRKPKTLLNLYIKRLKSIVIINIPPAFITATMLAVIQYLWGLNSTLSDCVIIFISINCMSIFFSVHYMTLYYVLQPYNAATEIKNPAYTVIKLITYYLCFIISRLEINSIYFGLGTILFTIIYCIISGILVFKLAPHTFKIRK